MPNPVPNDPVKSDDPTAQGPEMSAKFTKASAAAKTAAAHAAVKAAKVAHMQAKADMEKVGSEPAAQAAASAKVAQAHAAFKQAKANHIAAAEEEAKLKAAQAAARGEDDGDEDDQTDFEPGECNCRHCRTGLIDAADGGDDMHGDVDDDYDCTDPSCPCQNRWALMDSPDGPRNWNDPSYEVRADGKKRTKRVGGKDLTADKFAYVGDPERTETWKLPIHDEGHVRNALARFNQTQGIPANKKAGVYRKIVSAAKKFGIEVSDEKKSLVLATIPPDEEEVTEMRKRAEELRIRIETA